MDKIKKTHQKVMKQIKECKRYFKKVIKFINDNNIKSDDIVKSNLNILIHLWNNDKNADIDYYFMTREYHSYINFDNEQLNILWDNYKRKTMSLRLNLTTLNHEVFLYNT